MLTPESPACRSPDLPGPVPENMVLTDAQRIAGYRGRWWVLHTRARHEKCVAEALDLHGVAYYMPLVGVRHVYAKRKVSFHLPLFPGYVFLCGDEHACDVARRTNRLAAILRVDAQEQFRHELVQVSRALDSRLLPRLHPGLKVGRRCRVVSGPLKDTEGVVVAHGQRCELFLAVSILGQSVVVEVDAALLMGLPAEEAADDTSARALEREQRHANFAGA